MKLLARALALALVAIGATASTHIARAAEPTVSAKASFTPIPMCPPDGSTSCGLEKLGW